MALKDLPNDYQPQAGDMRSESLLDVMGRAKLDVYTGETWTALHPASGDELEYLTAGAENLGRRLDAETGRLAYYWRGFQTGPVTWWTCQKTMMNTRWNPPLYGLGEMVWPRVGLRDKPRLITGVALIEAYHDTGSFGEDDDFSTPQSWEYRFADGTCAEESALIGKAELVKLLVSVPVRETRAAEDFDPFLDLP